MVTLGMGRFLRRVLGVSQSAPAMVVFHILFMWAVYIAVIREGTSLLFDHLRYFAGVDAITYSSYVDKW